MGRGRGSGNGVRDHPLRVREPGGASQSQTSILNWPINACANFKSSFPKIPVASRVLVINCDLIIDGLTNSLHINQQ